VVRRRPGLDGGGTGGPVTARSPPVHRPFTVGKVASIPLRIAPVPLPGGPVPGHVILPVRFVPDRIIPHPGEAPHSRSTSQARHRVNQSPGGTLTDNGCQTIRRRYRTILAQGKRELPDIPPRPKGKRGRIARSDAHNLHERPVRHEDPCCASWPTPMPRSRTAPASAGSAWPGPGPGCRAASEPGSTPTHGAGSQATSAPWPLSDTTRSSPSRSLSPETPPTWSPCTTPRRGEQLPGGKHFTRTNGYPAFAAEVDICRTASRAERNGAESNHLRRSPADPTVMAAQFRSHPVEISGNDR